MTRLEKIERELRAFGDFAVRIRPADHLIPRITFTCWRGCNAVKVGHGDTLEEAFAMLLDKEGPQEQAA